MQWLCDVGCVFIEKKTKLAKNLQTFNELGRVRVDGVREIPAARDVICVSCCIRTDTGIYKGPEAFEPLPVLMMKSQRHITPKGFRYVECVAIVLYAKQRNLPAKKSFGQVVTRTMQPAQPTHTIARPFCMGLRPSNEE